MLKLTKKKFTLKFESLQDYNTNKVKYIKYPSARAFNETFKIGQR